MVAVAITGFMNAHIADNEFVSSSGSTHMKGSNVGVDRKSAATENCLAQIGGHNTNTRDYMTQISYYHFGIINN